jgi:4-hydroxy-tetrahydrodipicolinate reductase
MTVRIGIAGIHGRMGREIATLANTDPSITLIGGLSRRPDPGGPNGQRIVCDVAELLPDIDVLIDFSSAEGAVTLASACAAAGTPLVSGTTGLDQDQRAALRAAAGRVAVFQAANMSPGVNAVIAVLPALVRALTGYDLEIVEAHHRHKADAPSGTALALARVIAEASGSPLAARARHGREGASLRAAGEIGIHAVRGGGNPGEHAVIIAGDGEEVRLSHRAFSRAAYAEGALRAARLIAGQPPGWYEPATLPGFL